MHLDLAVSRYSPSAHLVQNASLVAVPATSRSVPAVHDGVECGSHTSAVDTAALNLPAAHGMHWPSAVVVPTINPSPAPHVVTVYGMHLFWSSAAENRPAVHTSHRASLAVAVPAVKPIPAVHEVVEWSTHGEASGATEYWPAVHAGHEASSAVAEPPFKPWPGGHDVTVLSLQLATFSCLSWSVYFPTGHATHGQLVRMVHPAWSSRYVFGFLK